jgi:anti-anti-sigma factor
LTGPLTLATLFDFQEAVRQTPQLKTIIDLSEVKYIDSAGLGALLSFHGACKRNGRNYALVGMSPRVHTLFTASKVDKLVHIFPNARAAEESLGK